MLLSGLAKKYRLRKLGSASQSSLQTWEIAFRMFDRHLGREATIDDLDDDVFCEFIEWRRESVSAATVNRDLVSLLACWRWGHRIGLIPRWPQVTLQKVPTRTPIAWTEAEFNQLLATARTWQGDVGSAPGAIWWPALLLVLFDSGERITACLSLQWSNLSLDSGWARFLAETRKGQREDSLLRLHPETCDAVAPLRRYCNEYVFDWPYGKKYIWLKYGKLLEAAGLPNDRSRKFHCIRKTTASYVEAAGGNATLALRHSNRTTTLAYLDPRIVTPPQSVDYLWRPNPDANAKQQDDGD